MQRADGHWSIETEKGTVVAQHVVNAGGLWARRVGRMVGVDYAEALAVDKIVFAEGVSGV